MYTALIVTTTLQFVAIVGCAFVIVTKSKAVKELAESLASCRSALGSYDGVHDAETHLRECQHKADEAIREADAARAKQEQESQVWQQRKREIRLDADKQEVEIQRLQKTRSSLEKLISQYQSVVGDFKSLAKLKKELERFQKLVGIYKTSAELQNRIEQQQEELRRCAEAMNVAANAQEILAQVRYYENLVGELRAEVDAIEETRDLQQFGVYRPQYTFEHSKEYKDALDGVVARRKHLIKAGQAAIIPPGITVAGDERAGKKLGDEYAKVMLRAFNGEADASIAKAKYNNMQMLQDRMTKSRDRINRLGQTMQIEISQEYLDLRLQELRLAYEWERKKQQEREEQAYFKELAREEEKARREAAKAEKEAAEAERKEQQRLAEKEALLAELRKELEVERLELANRAALSKEEYAKLTAELSEKEAVVTNLESQRDTLITAVKEAHERRERALSLAQMTKRGYVYILSNIGSFGDGWFKIGMTRREDPNVRVRELASASVPFPFDIHAMVLSDDAPALENKLHTYFADRRVNKVNPRKEFFEVTIDEIREAIDKVYTSPVQFKQILPEAAEYRETEAIRREENGRPMSIRDRLESPSFS